MKRRKQILSILMAFCLTMAILPTGMVTAWAEEDTADTDTAAAGKAIQLVKDGVAENLSTGCNTQDAATVWYGKEGSSPWSWRVIGYNGDGAAAEPGCVTLLSAGNFGVTKFNENTNSSVYIDSTLKIEIDKIADKFGDGERKAVVKRDLESGSYQGKDTDCVAGDEVKDAVLWPLSTKEAESVAIDLRIIDLNHTNWASSWWWLRSPGDDDYSAALVRGEGNVNVIGEFALSLRGVRPAFYLDLNSVLLTSAAEGGKSSGDDGNLSEIEGYTGSDWKLTLKDDAHKSFSIDPTKTKYIDRQSVTVSYSGEVTGDNEYISAVIVNSSGEITHYGKIVNLPSSAQGNKEVTIDLKGKYNTGDTLYVFNEQCNGDKETDYASELQTVLSPAMQLVRDGGASNLGAGCNTKSAATVWFGKNHEDNNADWRVIGYNGNGVASEKGNMTLLAVGNIGQTKFDESGKSNVYNASILKNKIEEIANKFGDGERNAVVKRDLESGSYQGKDTDCLAGDEVKDAVLWPLSTKEAERVAKDLRIVDPEHPGWATSNWWLRSPGDTANSVAVVGGSGFVYDHGFYVIEEYGIHPAFNLNLNSVLFTSSSDGGKSSATDGSLSEIGNYTGTDWKLTLLDSSRKFSVTEKSATVKSGESVRLNYTNATVSNDASPNEYISAILADKDGNLLYYGRLLQPDKADGEVSINLPDELECGEYTLKLFNEQYNGDYMTDYASDFSDVKLTINTSEKDCPKDDTCPITPFTDTDRNAWYHDGVHWALHEKVMNGTSDNTFEPMNATTRAMIVTMLWRMEGSPVVDYYMTFKDVPDGKWYTEAIRWAASNGVVNGYNEETFGTEEDVTREQLATILYRSAKAKGQGFSGGWAFPLQFDDADQISDWANEAMHWMVMTGVMNGVSEKELSPRSDAVRAQVATMLMRFSERMS